MVQAALGRLPRRPLLVRRYLYSNAISFEKDTYTRLCLLPDRVADKADALHMSFSPPLRPIPSVESTQFAHIISPLRFQHLKFAGCFLAPSLRPHKHPNYPTRPPVYDTVTGIDPGGVL
jgi:hypothetical protein